MENKYLKLTESSISGIKNPLLLLHGKLYIKEYKFKVLADTKIVNYNLQYDKDFGNFCLEAPLTKKMKHIKVFLVVSNEEIMIYNAKNTILKRICYKLSVTIKKIIRKIARFASLSIRAIKFIFRNFRYIIWPSNWSSYYKIIKKKIHLNQMDGLYSPYVAYNYQKWVSDNVKDIETPKLKYNPLISILIPVYNIDRLYLTECLDSILASSYENFEVCIADDNSTNKETLDTLREFEKKDPRIKVVYRKKNGHISESTNSALDIAKGEYIALMDDDDVITQDALYEFVKVLNEDKSLDMIYSDEDKMEMNGELCEPHFKPDYSPDTLYGGNYICHLTIYRTSIAKSLGGFRTEYNGAQDFDFVLRFVEKTDKIYHIPKALYHWRKVPGSTAVTIKNKDYAIENGRKAVADALKRRKTPGRVVTPIKSTQYIVYYDVVDTPKVSIIIPTKDNAKLLNNCLESIYKKSTYRNFEIIVMNNGSTKEETFRLFKKYENKYDNFKVIDANYEFNYAKINNDAVVAAKGEYVLLLNNDTKVITEDFLEVMLGYAMQDHIGAVGAKMVYPDMTIQSGGIILGINGIGADSYNGLDKDNYGTDGRLLVPYDYSAVTGACLMVKKDKYESVNGLDELLAVAYNDIDFCLKLLDKGYYNVFLPMVKIIHFESKSRGEDDSEEKKNRLFEEATYMKNKWSDKLIHDRFYSPNFSLKWWFMLDRRQ